MADAKKLARLHRVRTLQLGLVRAEEARAHDKFAREHSLSVRIAALADAVAPTTDSAAGFSLTAAAHFRDRLHQSAQAAASRVDAAEQFVNRATEATRAARRDQNAVEKLIARADADAAIAAIRAMEGAPSVVRKRHDPC